MAQMAFLDLSVAPCIHGTGTETIGQFQSCTWVTPNGSTAVLVITNAGTNELTIVVSGAPEAIYATDGSRLNGQHALPPNAPTANVTSIGDFKGQQVMIFNMSNPASNAQVVTSTPQPC